MNPGANQAMLLALMSVKSSPADWDPKLLLFQQTMSDAEPFFSRGNIYKAIWSLLLGVLGFSAGLLWSAYKGKDKVVIATTEDGAKPIVVRVETTPDDPARLTLDRIDVLVEEVRRLRGQATPDHSSARTTSNATTGSAESSIDTAAVASSRNDMLPDVESHALNRPFLPKFELPKHVHGYSLRDLAGFGRAQCPANNIKAGNSIVVRLILNGGVNVDELTPVFLTVARPTAKNTFTQVSEQQFVLEPGVNQFQVPFDVPAGSYRFDVGFHSRAELKEEYPPFYGLVCDVIVE
jgi:hypothetical protein